METPTTPKVDKKGNYVLDKKGNVILIPIKYVCSECGSDLVQEKMWFDLNTGEVEADDEPIYYCGECCSSSITVKEIPLT